MSSPSTADPNDGAPKSFFCHQCNQTVTIILLPSSDPLCPLCNDGFLEELEIPNPNPPTTDSFLSEQFSSLLPMFFPSSSSTTTTTIDLQNPSFFTRDENPIDGPGNNLFDPIVFFQNHLQNLRSSGAHIQLVIENHGGSGLAGAGNLGDYFVGPGLEQLIQQLAENDPNRYGTPPASKSAIENLPTVTVMVELTNSENNQCAVCQDDFEIGMELKQMPCKHVYHPDCLLPWLELHNSCPVCRHELPTDDAEYENRRGGGGRGGDGGSVGGEGGGGLGERTLRRSFSIMLPYPYSSGSGGQGN